MINKTGVQKMKNYNWTGFAPAEKKEVLDEINNCKDWIAAHQKTLTKENYFNTFYKTWSHDEATRLIKQYQIQIKRIENDYGLRRK
tara:strand:- start:145 stop:402 length:258 start_codon:yes stop_codon:yes gene_type:complete